MSADRYAAIHAAHRWEVPALFNIAHACCGRWAADRALRAVLGRRIGATAAYVLGSAAAANRLANALAAVGIGRADKVALVLPQRPETVVAHIAATSCAVTVPLSFLFGPTRSNTGSTTPKQRSHSSTRSRCRISSRSATVAPGSRT
jgi:acetyl-CoA synthetase